MIEKLGGISMTKQLSRCTNWFGFQVERALQARLDVLQQLRLGALRRDREPIIIWVEMFDRPFKTGDQAIVSCNKYNKAVNETATLRKNSQVLQIGDLSLNEHFDIWGNLNAYGKAEFWRNLDDQLQQFDEKQYGLNPRMFVQNVPACDAPADARSANSMVRGSHRASQHGIRHDYNHHCENRNARHDVNYGHAPFLLHQRANLRALEAQDLARSFHHIRRQDDRCRSHARRALNSDFSCNNKN